MSNEELSQARGELGDYLIGSSVGMAIRYGVKYCIFYYVLCPIIAVLLMGFYCMGWYVLLFAVILVVAIGLWLFLDSIKDEWERKLRSTADEDERAYCQEKRDAYESLTALLLFGIIVVFVLLSFQGCSKLS